MKQILFLLFAALVVVSCSEKQPENIAKVQGKVLTADADKVVFEYIRKNPVSDKTNMYVAEIDDTGNFSIDIPVSRLSIGRIVSGGFYHVISLAPGDDFTVHMDGDTIRYAGKGANKNNYLYQAEINGMNDNGFYSISRRGELPLEEFYNEMLSFKQKRIDFFNAFKDSVKLDKNFIAYQEAETEVIFESQIQGYPRRYAYYNKISPNKLELPDEYKALNNFSNYADDKKIASFRYIGNLRNRLYAKSREISKADTAVKYREAFYVAMFDSLSGKTREYIVAKWISNELTHDRYDSVAIARFNELEKDEISESVVANSIAKYKEKRALINQPLHTEFAETMLADTANNSLRFADMMEKYKGKIVYLDMWSMGCGPCRAAMPQSKKLKEKLKDLPVEFVYITMEQARNNDWKPLFDVSLTKENHYVMKNGFHSRLNKFLEVNWVPNYMIFNKEGKLIDYAADRPHKVIDGYESVLEKRLKELAGS